MFHLRHSERTVIVAEQDSEVAVAVIAINFGPDLRVGLRG
jgi:hypothetical protein